MMNNFKNIAQEIVIKEIFVHPYRLYQALNFYSLD